MHDDELSIPAGAVATGLIQYPIVATSNRNSVEGYVRRRPALPRLLLRPGMVGGEVLAANVAAMSVYAVFSGNSYLLLDGQRHFAMTFNVVLACILLVSHMALGRWTNHVPSARRFNQPTVAGAAMALLTGIVLFVSIGANAVLPLLLLVMTLVLGGRSVHHAYRTVASGTLPASTQSSAGRLFLPPR